MVNTQDSREILTTQKSEFKMEPPLNSFKYYPPRKNHALFSSDREEWNTPPEIIKSVIEVLGNIDLDPCSNSDITPNIPADMHYTKGDDGLGRPWMGNVYMNPPYGRDIIDWIKKVVYEYEYGDVSEAIVLVPARTDTKWFKIINEYPFCLIEGRLKFSGSKNSATFPSVVFYLGEYEARFIEIFKQHGAIFRRI